MTRERPAVCERQSVTDITSAWGGGKAGSPSPVLFPRDDCQPEQYLLRYPLRDCRYARS